MFANCIRTLNLIATVSIALLAVSDHACAEWTRLEDDEMGTAVYVDRTTLHRINDSASKLWTLVDFTSPQEVAGRTFRSSKIRYQYDCIGERARILHMSLHSGSMGLGKMLHSDSARQKWEPVSPVSLGSASFDYACSILSIDGSKHKYSQDEIPGWKQGPSSKDADFFFAPRSIKRNKGQRAMWTITNFKEPLRDNSRLHWSSKSRIEYDCQKYSSRLGETYFYDLPYAKGKPSGVKPSTNDWYPITDKSPERGLLNIVCDK